MIDIFFDRIGGDYGVMVISWKECGPCKAIAPFIEKYIKEYDDIIPIEYLYLTTDQLNSWRFVKLVNKIKDIYGVEISSFPSIYVLRDNKIEKRVNRHELRDWLDMVSVEKKK